MNLNDLLDELEKLSRIALLALLPLTAAFILTGYLANSLTIGSMALENGASIIVQLFAFQSIRAMRSADPIRFPHGTGKLENFSGFLYGALTIPTACYILFHAVQNLLNPADHVAFGLAQLPLIPSLLVNIYIFRFARRLRRRSDSPLVESYLIDYRVAVWFDVIVILAMAAGLVLNHLGAQAYAAYIDPAFSFGIALYMLRAAVGQLLSNFRVLIDLPMPEPDQLQIMRVLAEEFDAYEQLGSIRTRRSGAQRFVEVELYFGSSVDVRSISALNTRMQQKLRATLGDVKLVILVMELAEGPADALLTPP